MKKELNENQELSVIRALRLLDPQITMVVIILMKKMMMNLKKTISKTIPQK